MCHIKVRVRKSTGKRKMLHARGTPKKQKRAEQGGPCSALIVEGDIRFKQDFPTVYFREDYATIAATETGKLGNI